MTDFDDFLKELQEQSIANARMIYSETVIDHFLHPRNFRLMDNPDGFARIKGPCGDTMEIFLRLQGNQICEVSFNTDGCITTIASASMTVELATGKSTQDARRVTQNKILECLGGLPKESEHCALLAANTLHAAITDYLSGKKEPWKRLYRPDYTVS